MFGDKLHVYPICLSIYVPVSFAITYAIAVANDHVEAGFPYISDTGTHPPESCVFGQLLNLGAALGAVTVYIRYRQIESQFSEGQIPKKLRIHNIITLTLGLLMALGVSIVGNFQETNVVVVHVIGAFMAFGLGWIYCVLQTYISFITTHFPGNRHNIRLVRVVITALDFIFLVALMISGQIAQSKLPKGKEHLKWTSSDPGFGEHLVSTISEWIMAVLTVLFILTFVQEFKMFEMEKPRLSCKTRLENNVHKSEIPIEGEETKGAPA